MPEISTSELLGNSKCVIGRIVDALVESDRRLGDHAIIVASDPAKFVLSVHDLLS